MMKDLDKELQEIIDKKYNNQELIRAVNNEFAKKNFNTNTTVGLFLDNTVQLKNLDVYEKIALTKACYSILRKEEVNPDKYFNSKELLKYENYINDPNKKVRLEFIGQKYETEDEKQRILQTYDEYQLAKIEYLNNEYESDKAKFPYFLVYNNNLHYAEVAYKKDLKFFTQEEIESTIKSCIYASDSTRKTMGVFCNLYCEYWHERGDIDVNPCNGIILKDLAKNNFKILKTKLYDMDKFLNICRLMMNKANPQHIKPLLLARYGVIGKEAIFMRRLRWKDIDSENMVVKIFDEKNEFMIVIPIDNRFIEFLVQLHGFKPEQKEKLLKSEAYVLDDKKLLNYGTVNSRVNTVCKSVEGLERISFGDLLFTRQLELLLKIRKGRKINTEDVKKVIGMFTEQETVNSIKVTTLKNRYEELTGDTVPIYFYARPKEKTELELTDGQAESFVDGICEKLSLSI